MASVAFPKLSKTHTVSDGTKYGYIKVPAKPGKPTLLFLHGYPSSSFHWIHQVSQCQSAGYGMLAPDLLGYGDTDKPTDMAKYDNTVMATHLGELLDAEGIERCVAVGHDWGSILLSTFARSHAGRISLLIFLAVGYGPSQERLTDIDGVNDLARQTIGRPLYGYWYFHNKPEAARMIEDANARDPAGFASLLFPADPDVWIANICEPGGMEAWIREGKSTEMAGWIGQAELEMHGRIMKEGGFTGPLNWYKQAMAGVTAASESHLSEDDRKIATPTLLVTCEKDVICVPKFQVLGAQPYVADLTVKNVDTGHWCMLEKPEETWTFMDEYIKEKLGLGSKGSL